MGSLSMVWRCCRPVAIAAVVPVDATRDVQELLDSITSERCFDPQIWRDFVAVAELIPDGEVLPVRADYRPEDWSIGVNPLHAESPCWYTLADLIASKLLTGRTPRIRRAIRFVPEGVQAGLSTVRLRDSIEVDPARQDFFRVVVEARQRLKAVTVGHPKPCPCAECADAGFLKVLANAGSYGIYAEVIQTRTSSQGDRPCWQRPQLRHQR